VRLRIRVLAAAGLIAVVSLLTFGVLLNGLHDQRDVATRARATTDGLNSARELRRLTLTMESDARGFLLTGNDTFRTAFGRARDEIEPTTAKLARTESDPAQRRDIAEITRLLDGYASYLDTAIASGSVAQDTSRFDAIDAALARYTAAEAREQLAFRAESNRLRNRAITIAVVGLALLLVLIAVIAYVAERAIVEPVERQRRAEAGRERLQSATAALAAASSIEDVAAATVTEATRSLDTTTAAMHMLEQGALYHVGGLSGGRRERWGKVSMQADLPLTEVVRTGEAVFFDDVDALRERWPLSPETRAFAVLPLVASGRVLGALSLMFAHPITFDEDERALLLALASQSSVALARAQLYEREHSVAQTLQASLLPSALPEIEGLDLAGRLEAGAPGVDVGGDFYDAFAISDGVWGIAIGDVCGKGVDAAALTALARHTLRAAAHERRTPSEVLEALNRAVLDESRPGQFLTAIFGRLEVLPAGRFRLVFACGGHPPPVLLDAELAPRPLRCYGTLLGVVEDPELVDATVELEIGDTLLLYTDGLTEAGAPSRLLTTEDVARLLAKVRGHTASQTAESCLDEALAASGGVIRDDIAVLVAQVGVGVISTAGRTAAGESSTRGQ
jgi:serine phosphatase RsbU (regulator of sigma subunit)/CHASE3 domain sensor protein